MIRKLSLSAVMATATLTGLTMTPASAEAHPPVAHRLHRFEVLVQCSRGWENRGMFGNRFEAERIAERLRCEGFHVRILEC